MNEAGFEKLHVTHQPGTDLRIYDPALRVDYTIEAEGHWVEKPSV